MSTYSIDAGSNLVHMTFTGAVSVDDVIGLTGQILADPMMRPGMHSLVNLSEATIEWSPLDLDRFRSYVSSLKRHRVRPRSAVVFSKSGASPTVRAFVALHNAFGEGSIIKLFTRYESALAWVNPAGRPQETAGLN